jgi:hypothetical protein
LFSASQNDWFHSQLKKGYPVLIVTHDLLTVKKTVMSAVTKFTRGSYLHLGQEIESFLRHFHGFWSFIFQ